MKERVVIIGASITGVYAMSKLVRSNFDGDITLIDKKDVLPYNTYPLSKEWMMDYDEMDPPFLMKDGYYKENNIDLKLNTKVDTINWKDKTVTTNGDETVPYDHLIIATGSKLREVEIPGDDANGVFYLREFKDAKKIKEWVKDIENVVIIGSGFIGLELASTFSQLNKHVSVMVRSGKPLEKILGEEVSEYFTKMHESHGVNFLYNEEAEKINKDDKGNIKSILTKSGKTVKCEMVIIAVGVGPNFSFDIDTLDMDHGAIVVNKYGETSIPDIYAGGDIVMWPYKDRLVHIEHWENAWSQGISIAENIMEEKSNEYNEHPYFWTDQYDQTFEYLGNARNWAKTFVRGSLDNKNYAVAYVDENNYPLGILFANESEERKDIERLLNKNEAIDEAKFTDLSIAISEI
ncbi:MAG: FAD-dependent oxidoreductase [Tissierellia bacterium]|nr:FAD-dependent oxidoreductase [Tissierellia bacterium]